MAKRKDREATGSEEPEIPIVTPVSAEANGTQGSPSQAFQSTEANGELPEIESPPISPADFEPATTSEISIAPKHEPEVAAIRPEPVFALVPLPGPSVGQAAESSNKQTPLRFSVKARHRRYAVLAASVAIGAVFGAFIGVQTSGGLVTVPKENVAAIDNSQAMQQSLKRLANDVSVLKAKLEAAGSQTQKQTSGLIKPASEEITGSISVPQPVAVAPVPTPRPALHVATAESKPIAATPVVRDWSIRAVRGGYIYVETHGEIYQIVPGAPLPGLGPVQSIKRQEGRWVVTTPKGIIVSMRDRRFFE